MGFNVGIILWFITGNMFSYSISDSKEIPAVSVIIAIRNGEDALAHLLTDLSSQDYSGEMEFILVDDESKDSTEKIILEKSSIDKRFIYESSTHGDHILRKKKTSIRCWH